MSYYSIGSHRSMTFDERRNSAYLKALKQVITPDSVVLDLGAGLGMLGLQAAKLGAKKVYLVEPEDVISVTREIVTINGFDDRIVCLQGKIEKVDIPEPVDVIISVFTGNFLLGEDLLPSLFFARDRYLKPGGVLIPSAATMEAAPISVPEIFEEVIDVWSTPHLGIDQSPARAYANQQIYWYGKDLKKAQYLAASQPLMELNFYTATQTHCQTQASYVVKENDCCHGFAGWFKMQLGEDWLSTAPYEPPLHWSAAYLPLDPPLEVMQGDDLEFRLIRPTYGDWTWQVALNDQRQQRSTFFATPMTLKTLRQQAPDYKPSLNDKGAAALYVLSHSDKSLTIEAMGEQLALEYPQQFSDFHKAMSFVKGLVGSFSH